MVRLFYVFGVKKTRQGRKIDGGVAIVYYTHAGRHQSPIISPAGAEDDNRACEQSSSNSKQGVKYRSTALLVKTHVALITCFFYQLLNHVLAERTPVDRHKKT